MAGRRPLQAFTRTTQQWEDPVMAADRAKFVYSFGGGSAEGRAEMKALLGGKGANLAEMANLRLPVPPGFTISTEVCTAFYKNNRAYPDGLDAQIRAALETVERISGAQFGNPENPLLVSVRSGARASMPGMMDTVLNLGLNDMTVEGLAKRSGDRRFAFDSYRRFISMYADVVLGVDHDEFEDILGGFKDERGYTLDTQVTAEEWQGLVARYEALVEE
ncbi:PEP/pyruvate-binding domain-containing protein, partial [Aestuariivirga sp.]|uniref:PEP/pyruvate-binding domain-containing protein n=1 Tax=Aestuariivirga sp. TaxID=2650926 RepID=UPI0035B01BB5